MITLTKISDIPAVAAILDQTAETARKINSYAYVYRAAEYASSDPAATTGHREAREYVASGVLDRNDPIALAALFGATVGSTESE